MNFYIANTTVVIRSTASPPMMPRSPRSRSCSPVAARFAVDGKAVVVGGAAFHCSTQQQPRV